MNPFSLCSYTQARLLIEQGELLIYPTETYYALGTALSSPHKEDIYRVKERPYNKPLPLIVHSIEQATHFTLLSSQAKELMTYFPHLTVIVPSCTPYMNTDTIAIRRATTPLLTYLTQNTPLIATSANRSNHPAVASYTDLDSSLTSIIPVCLPACKEDTPQGKAPSTIITLQNDNIHIIRQGTITKEELSLFYKRTQR